MLTYLHFKSLSDSISLLRYLGAAMMIMGMQANPKTSHRNSVYSSGTPGLTPGSCPLPAAEGLRVGMTAFALAGIGFGI